MPSYAHSCLCIIRSSPTDDASVAEEIYVHLHEGLWLGIEAAESGGGDTGLRSMLPAQVDCLHNGSAPKRLHLGIESFQQLLGESLLVLHAAGKHFGQPGHLAKS